MKRPELGLPKLSREQVLESAKLSNPEARVLVSSYYTAQEARKAADMQLRHIGDKDGMPLALKWTGDANAVIEKDLLSHLTKFVEASPVGRWMLAQHGVGPVIAAGMLAHLDIEQAPTVGHWWRYAGRDPSTKWEKGQKRPYNAQMKQLCFHTGECFKRTSGNADAFYGSLYKSRKVHLEARNEAGGFAEKAAIYKTNSADVRKLCATGKVPQGYLDLMATAFATKIFMSHLHAITYWNHYGKAPPKPFAISALGHAHEIIIPHHEMFPGFGEAYYGAPLAKAA